MLHVTRYILFTVHGTLNGEFRVHFGCLGPLALFRSKTHPFRLRYTLHEQLVGIVRSILVVAHRDSDNFEVAGYCY